MAERNSHGGIAFGAQRHAGDRMDDSQEPIEGHQHQRVDARMACDHNHVLDLCLNPLERGREREEKVISYGGLREDDACVPPTTLHHKSPNGHVGIM